MTRQMQQHTHVKAMITNMTTQKNMKPPIVIRMISVTERGLRSLSDAVPVKSALVAKVCCCGSYKNEFENDGNSKKKVESFTSCYRIAATKLPSEYAVNANLVTTLITTSLVSEFLTVEDTL